MTFRKLKICYVTDYRSPISRNWIRYFANQGHDIHVISPYPVPNPDPGVSIHVIPYALTRFRSTEQAQPGHSAASQNWKWLFRRIAHQNLALARIMRDWLAPLDIYPQGKQIRKLLADIQPDLVHAMRIPFEGIVAALANPDVPLIVSIWGNDFTLHARSALPVSLLTRKVMRRTDGLHTDCDRDLRLAPRWGFDTQKPHINLPGAGGIQTAIFYPATDEQELPSDLVDIPHGVPVIVNPRGPSAYIRNDIFFQAVARVLSQRPDAVFVCPVMQHNPVMEKWVHKLGIENSVRLLPRIRREQMAGLFRAADVTVSLATHDGTPNTLLEAMACGCLPVVGDIETVHEWIEHEKNGLICPITDAAAVSDAILRAITDSELRAKARVANLQLITERAAYEVVMARAEAFYHEVLATTHRR